MKRNFRYFSIALVVCLAIIMGGNSANAQDTGKPAIRSVAYYTIGGGVLGAGIGIAYWMLDPLAPSADLRGSVMQGYGVGVFFGFIFGVLQLNKQAVFPYTEPMAPSEFDGNSQIFPPAGNSYPFAAVNTKPRAPQIPLFSFQYTF
jgi:hypothetical protein